MIPTRKVNVGAAAGAAAAILVYLMETFKGVKVPADIGIALTALGTAVLQYFVPDAVDPPEA